MENETLVDHLGGANTPTNEQVGVRRSRLRSSLSEPGRGQSLCDINESASVTHLDDHLKGEHASEDIIKVPQDLQNTQNTHNYTQEETALEKQQTLCLRVATKLASELRMSRLVVQGDISGWDQINPVA